MSFGAASLNILADCNIHHKSRSQIYPVYVELFNSANSLSSQLTFQVEELLVFQVHNITEPKLKNAIPSLSAPVPPIVPVVS
eukprot:gene1459-1931_t